MLANWAGDPRPSEFDAEVSLEIARIEHAILRGVVQILEEFGGLQAAMKRSVALNEAGLTDQADSRNDDPRHLATWRSRPARAGAWIPMRTRIARASSDWNRASAHQTSGSHVHRLLRLFDVTPPWLAILMWLAVLQLRHGAAGVSRRRSGQLSIRRRERPPLLTP